MSSSKDMSHLLESMRAAGFVITPHNGNRYGVAAPDGDLTFMSSKGSTSSALRNARAWAYRHGLPRPDARPASPEPSPEPSPERAVVNGGGRPSPASMPGARRSLRPQPVPAQPVPAERDPAPAVPVSSVRAMGPNLPAGHPALPAAGGHLVPKGSGVWVEVGRPVSPEIARSMLEYNIDNRPIVDRLVDSWSRTMVSGGWVEAIGDPIRFASTGKLLDGQKRLKAVVKSGVTVKFDVVTGLSESSQDVMDSGQHRSPADQLKINGIKNHMVVAAAVRLLWLWDRDALISNNPAPSNAEQLDYFLELTGATSSIEESAAVASTSGAKRWISPSVIAACHYRMVRADGQAAMDFFEKLGSGANLPVNSPILALRETMRLRREAGKKLTQAQQVYLVGRAWTLWRKGGSASRLPLPKSSLTMAHIPFIS